MSLGYGAPIPSGVDRHTESAEEVTRRLAADHAAARSAVEPQRQLEEQRFSAVIQSQPSPDSCPVGATLVVASGPVKGATAVKHDDGSWMVDFCGRPFTVKPHHFLLEE